MLKKDYLKAKNYYNEILKIDPKNDDAKKESGIYKKIKIKH